MTEVFDLVFEQVQPTRVVPLFTRLLSDSVDLKYIECSEELGEDFDAENGERLLCAAVASRHDLCVSAPASALRIDGAVLPNTLLRLLKYGDKFDVEVTFDVVLSDRDQPCFARRLQVYALGVAGEFNVTSCFAGVEPASDFDTRIFTDAVIGPLSLCSP